MSEIGHSEGEDVVVSNHLHCVYTTTWPCSLYSCPKRTPPNISSSESKGESDTSPFLALSLSYEGTRTALEHVDRTGDRTSLLCRPYIHDKKERHPVSVDKKKR
jgi:hypothetical protein